MFQPCRWAPHAQVDNITVTIDGVWVNWKTLFTAAAKQCTITVETGPWKFSSGNSLARTAHAMPAAYPPSSPTPKSKFTCRFLRSSEYDISRLGRFLSESRVIQRRSYVKSSHWNEFLRVVAFWELFPGTGSVLSSPRPSVSHLRGACAVDIRNCPSVNKRGMTSLNVLRARSEDDFHKQITQVVHVWEQAEPRFKGPLLSHHTASPPLSCVPTKCANVCHSHIYSFQLFKWSPLHAHSRERSASMRNKAKHN